MKNRTIPNAHSRIKPMTTNPMTRL